jgi:hypothetical protein
MRSAIATKLVSISFCTRWDYETVRSDCGKCKILLNDLQDAASSLQQGLLRMSAVVGTRDRDAFDAALVESEILRMECRAVRREVERHKAQHLSVETED